jgi:hypothetical protein
MPIDSDDLTEAAHSACHPERSPAKSSDPAMPS